MDLLETIIEIEINYESGTTLSGAKRPAITFKIVDFPVPEGPIIPTASPCLIYNIIQLSFWIITENY